MDIPVAFHFTLIIRSVPGHLRDINGRPNCQQKRVWSRLDFDSRGISTRRGIMFELGLLVKETRSVCCVSGPQVLC